MEAIVAQLASDSEDLHQVPGWSGWGVGRALPSVPPSKAPADRVPSPVGVMGIPFSLCSPTTCGAEGRGPGPILPTLCPDPGGVQHLAQPVLAGRHQQQEGPEGGRQHDRPDAVRPPSLQGGH